jgi:hypothetical protein
MGWAPIECRAPRVEDLGARCITGFLGSTKVFGELSLALVVKLCLVPIDICSYFGALPSSSKRSSCGIKKEIQ